MGKLLTTKDFVMPVTKALVDALNEEREKIRKMEDEVLFCRSHNFRLQEEALRLAVRSAMDVWVSVCNSLGKFF